MKYVDKIENMVGGWLRPVPRLPKSGQKWLGMNVWWIVLIGVIMGAIGLLMAVGTIFTAMALIGTVGVYGAFTVQAYDGLWFLAAIVGLVFSVLSVLILAVAISPLKAMRKKGWSLLFLSWVVNAVALVVNVILSFNPVSFIFGLIFGVIVLAISAYFIFEIRGEFTLASKPAAAKTSN